MTKHLRFLFVMLLAMIWSAGWAQTSTVVCTLAQSANNCKADVDALVTWKYSKETNGYDNDRGAQWANAKNVILTANFTSKIKITKIVINGYANNKGATAEIKVGSTSYGKKTFTKDKQLNYTYTGTEVNNVVTLTLNTNSKSIYINTVTITYEVPSSKTDTKVSFGQSSGNTFTFTEGKYSDGTFTTPTATETTGVAGTIAYSSSNATAISVDASTGELTFLGYGTATITATFTPNDTEKYVESTDSYIVENNQKVDESVILFSADAKSFESIKGTAYDKNIGDFVFVATNGKKYTFNVQKALKDKGRLQLNGSTVTSPSFPDFTKGYKVTVEYSMSSSKGSLTLSSGSNLVTGSNTQTKITLKVQNSSPFVIEKNSGTAAYIIKIEIIANKVDETTVISLDENSESNTIEAKTGVNVTLNRPMKIGQWNTFCVPFSIDANQVTSQFGEGTQIAEYSVSKSKDEVIAFATVQSNAIVAGKAYLVKPTKEAATEGYTFSNVNITALVPTKETVDNGAIDFRGIYNPTDITEDLPTNTFAAGIVGNVVKKAVNGSNMKGFRAFFIIPEGVGAQSSYMLKIDGTATSINSINGADVVVNAPVYNLQGQRVDGNNLTPGIYVKAGKKFVVK